ncbi:MAG: type I-A CRISPR-associated protein Cas5a [Sulfolobales archaeon]|nr:type I-A CRISPR-associated protein Cas5a [Sulfolobales archaeon]
MKLIIAKAKVFWGYSIKQPTQTAAQDPIPLPPPTTVLGALASPYAKYLKLPEVVKVNNRNYSTAVKLLLDDVVRYSTSGLMDSTAVKYSDISKNIMLIYQRHKGKEYYFAVQAMGKVYTPTMRESLLLAFIVNKDTELMSKLCWGITAIGNKEGLISVYDVATYDLKLIENTNQLIETPFITPSRIARCEAGCVEIDLCTLSTDSYISGKVCTKEPYLIPVYREVKDLYGGSMSVRADKGASIVEVPLETRKTYLLIPKEVVEL